MRAFKRTLALRAAVLGPVEHGALRRLAAIWRGVATGGSCQGITDEWLARTVPPPVNGPPDTRLSRCDWLWQYSADMRSTNGLGTLRSYVEQRLR